MKYMQRLGKALMLPVACLPICGLLMGLGYFLCPAAMQGGEMTGVAAHIGLFLVKAGGALIDHMALLFAIGVGVGLSEKNNGTGAVAALASWLMLTTLLSASTVEAILPASLLNENMLLAFSKIENPFIGILAGVIGSTCYNRFHNTRLPDWLSFFSGKRCVAIIAGLVSILVSAVLLFVWPVLFKGLISAGEWIASLGAFGAAIYAFLNRLLIPLGLHHALNNVFWFDTIGLGDLTHFWAGETSEDVSWSLGMYMSGFFPCMMFGIPGAALALVRSAKPEKRKKVIGIMISCAVCSFVCGVTEPFEFSFVFLAPVLYILYSLLYGIITFITVTIGFRAGFCFSGGITDLIFSSSLPAAQKTLLIIPLGIFTFAIFYFTFRLATLKWDFLLSGIEGDIDEESNEVSIEESNKASKKESDKENDNSDKYLKKAEGILKGLGGAGNVISVDSCITRLRLEVRDTSLIDEKVIKSAGTSGVIKTGKNSVQVVVGTAVQYVADELERLCEEIIEEVKAPAEGEVIPMEKIPDETFSTGVLGECYGIMPSEGIIYSPLEGTVSVVANTKHAVSFKDGNREVLVHVGIDTVKLGGEGFKVLVSEGDVVKQGQKVMEFDAELIKARGYNPMVVVVEIE